MKLTILQWNIWSREDIHHVAEFLKANKADVICLQELTYNHPTQDITDTPKFIAQQLGYHYYAPKIPLRVIEGREVLIANGIFSRFAIKDTRHVWINEPSGKVGGLDDEYRAYVEATLEIDGQELIIGTTHMSYTHRFEGTPQKEKETDRLVQELMRHNKNFIFTGDLNATPDSYTATEVNKHLQNLGPDFAAKTWTTKPFSYQGFEENKLNWRLDYIFGTRDIQVVSTEVLQTEYSDHLPVLAVVEV